MQLVNIDGNYINVEHIDMLMKNGEEQTEIYFAGTNEPFHVHRNIERVVRLIEQK